MTDVIPSGELVYSSLPDGVDYTVGATSQAIVQATGLSKSTVNARLKELVEAGRVIAFEGEGNARLYRQAFEGEENQDPPLFRQTIGVTLDDDAIDRDEPTEDVTDDIPDQRESTEDDAVIDVPTVEILSDDGPEGVDVAPDEGDEVTPTDDERDEADAEYADDEDDAAEASQTSPDETEWPAVTEVPTEPASSSLDDVAAFMGAVRPVSAPPADAEDNPKRARKREASDKQYAVFPPGGLQNAVLGLLQANPDKEWRASEVGNTLNAQAGSVTFALQTLQKKGNVIRTENPPRWKAA